MKFAVGAALVALAMSSFVATPSHAGDAGGTICGPACYPKTTTLPWPPKPQRPIRYTGRRCPAGYFRGHDGHTCYERLN